jgi:hypothetical protein
MSKHCLDLAQQSRQALSHQQAHQLIAIKLNVRVKAKLTMDPLQ